MEVPAPRRIGHRTSPCRLNGGISAPWTSPGDFGESAELYTPHWWKLKGQPIRQTEKLRVTMTGLTLTAMKISPVSSRKLELENHHSIRLRIGVKDDAKHRGGINIFGRGFGNYDQDIVLRLATRR